MEKAEKLPVSAKPFRRKPKEHTLVKHIKEDRELLLMTLPAVIKIFIFSYIPIFGIIIAFEDYIPAQGVFGSPLVGFKNFEFFFKSNSALTILRNTIGINVLNIVLATVANVLFALLLYEIASHVLLKIYQTVMFIPYFFSWVLVGLMMTALLGPTSGFLTNLIAHISGNHIDFYSQPWYWVIILPLVHVWKGVGFGSLIYYSVLMSIDKELFEAARIDGATKMQTIWNISLPFLMPMISVMTILAVGSIIRADFGLFYFVPQNVPSLYPVTDVIDTYVFRALAQNGDFTMSSAVGVFQSVVGFVLVIVTNKVAKKYNEDYALF